MKNVKKMKKSDASNEKTRNERGTNDFNKKR